MRKRGGDAPAVENTEFGAFARRILRAMSKRASGDVDALPDLLALRELVDQAMTNAVAACRAEGYSWADIGERLGTTKQNAQQRYGRTKPGSSIERQAPIDGQMTIDEVTE